MSSSVIAWQRILPPILCVIVATFVIESRIRHFPETASVRRLFIDEITSVAGWQKALKRLGDSGALRKVLIVTTGSKAGDIQREAELLPGRKGKLARTVYLFVQLPYKTYPREKLLVVSADRFDGGTVRGVTLEDFLLDETS